MVVDVSDDQRGGSIQIGFPQHETMHPRALSLAVAKTPSSAPIDLGFGHQICSPSPPSPQRPWRNRLLYGRGLSRLPCPRMNICTVVRCLQPEPKHQAPPPTHRLTAACSPNGLLQSSLTPPQRPRCTPRRLSNHIPTPSHGHQSCSTVHHTQCNTRIRKLALKHDSALALRFEVRSEMCS